MSLLKQIFTGAQGTTLIPTVEPTGTAYVNWKAKHYGSKLGYKARANAIDRYDEHAMKMYKKILEREAKYPIS
jgi:hypothetical protein